MGDMLWHRRETRRTTENTNFALQSGECPIYSKPRPSSEQLTETKDDKTRARLIAEAFDELEDRFPQHADLATQGHVRESELRLQKEIKKSKPDSNRK